uniref:Uncharacterized protein n=1 Tax=Candidatus Kentrum sp. FM TaxID=2126340 RepID=A0A450VM61_9GAMM|nr:MAG: hypothetical protein BECKFM1743C_GA0114222_1002311 [Candidatus Kentron sp. FM]VFK05893.1 MAG: hypothetical protein BECKFM1743B_GA0114221_1000611 [Candidatus Kentron sp. FM]
MCFDLRLTVPEIPFCYGCLQVKAVSVEEHPSLLILLPSFHVAMTVTSWLYARHCNAQARQKDKQAGMFFILLFILLKVYSR